MATRKSKAAKMVSELLEASQPKAKKKLPSKSKRTAKAGKQGLPATEPQTTPVEDMNAYVVIDYPTDGEIVTGLHYAIRIGASEPGRVELSFNGEEWQPARQGGGYWWYDWGYFAPGTYKITARLVDDSGRVITKSGVRKIEVQ